MFVTGAGLCKKKFVTEQAFERNIQWPWRMVTVIVKQSVYFSSSMTYDFIPIKLGSLMLNVSFEYFYFLLNS